MSDDKIMKSGACKFCGQRYMVEVETEDEEELERMATLACGCTEAVKAKEMGLSKEAAMENVDTLFAEEFPSITQILKNGIELIVKGKAVSVTVNTGMNVKAYVQQTPSGKIKVERFESRKKTMES